MSSLFLLGLALLSAPRAQEDGHWMLARIDRIDAAGGRLLAEGRWLRVARGARVGHEDGAGPFPRGLAAGMFVRLRLDERQTVMEIEPAGGGMDYPAPAALWGTER